MACTHPAAARPRAGSGEASIGSKERSSKRDAGLGAWRLSLSGEVACVKTVDIFDGGFQVLRSTAAKSRHKERISGHMEKNVAAQAEVEAEAGTAL